MSGQDEDHSKATESFPSYGGRAGGGRSGSIICRMQLLVILSPSIFPPKNCARCFRSKSIVGSATRPSRRPGRSSTHRTGRRRGRWRLRGTSSTPSSSGAKSSSKYTYVSLKFFEFTACFDDHVLSLGRRRCPGKIPHGGNLLQPGHCPFLESPTSGMQDGAGERGHLLRSTTSPFLVLVKKLSMLIDCNCFLVLTFAVHRQPHGHQLPGVRRGRRRRHLPARLRQPASLVHPPRGGRDRLPHGRGFRQASRHAATAQESSVRKLVIFLVALEPLKKLHI